MVLPQPCPLTSPSRVPEPCPWAVLWGWVGVLSLTVGESYVVIKGKEGSGQARGVRVLGVGGSPHGVGVGPRGPSWQEQERSSRVQVACRDAVTGGDAGGW